LSEILDKTKFEFAPLGVNKQAVEYISKRSSEPAWLKEFRLKALDIWARMKEPHWAIFDYEKINYEKLCTYAALKNRPQSMDEVDEDIKKAYEKLGVPLNERELLAGVVGVDAVLDGASVATTYKDKLKEVGIIFCPISEAAREHPDLVQKYLGSVVGVRDNFFACLNAAVFGDGTFVYVPKNTKCPIDLSTYFRINNENTGQFERTLIIADEGAEVNYLEGCTAPSRKEAQLHSAVVEIVALDNAKVKYSTVQNWYAGNELGEGGILNFVTKRALCAGKNSRVSWVQLEVGSTKTWKYPSCILKGEGSHGEFYSVALTNNKQQTDTGTKMIHVGKNTTSLIVSKGIAKDASVNGYRGLVKILKGAMGARNHTECGNMIIGDNAKIVTLPKLENLEPNSIVEHEASLTKISEEKLFYLRSRGLSEEEAISLVVSGFCADIIKKLPMEFAIEASKLLNLKLEKSIG
jgi:Fe-S cluster assembly protein SufB